MNRESSRFDRAREPGETIAAGRRNAARGCASRSHYIVDGGCNGEPATQDLLRRHVGRCPGSGPPRAGPGRALLEAGPAAPAEAGRVRSVWFAPTAAATRPPGAGRWLRAACAAIQGSTAAKSAGGSIVWKGPLSCSRAQSRHTVCPRFCGSRPSCWNLMICPPLSFRNCSTRVVRLCRRMGTPMAQPCSRLLAREIGRRVRFRAGLEGLRRPAVVVLAGSARGRQDLPSCKDRHARGRGQTAAGRHRQHRTASAWPPASSFAHTPRFSACRLRWRRLQRPCGRPWQRTRRVT